MCHNLGGTFHDPGVCDLDFSHVESSDLITHIEGVTSAGQLCGLLHGDYQGKALIHSPSHQKLEATSYLTNAKNILIACTLANFQPFVGTVCIINLQGAGTDHADIKMVACDELHGQWKENKCVLEDFQK